jgi:hypothetical protein
MLKSELTGGYNTKIIILLYPFSIPTFIIVSNATNAIHQISEDKF